MQEAELLGSSQTNYANFMFVFQEDTVCLVCTSGDAMKRGYLAAKGFGSQHCHLEPEPRNEVSWCM